MHTLLDVLDWVTNLNRYQHTGIVIDQLHKQMRIPLDQAREKRPGRSPSDPIGSLWISLAPRKTNTTNRVRLVLHSTRKKQKKKNPLMKALVQGSFCPSSRPLRQLSGEQLRKHPFRMISLGDEKDPEGRQVHVQTTTTPAQMERVRSSS